MSDALSGRRTLTVLWCAFLAASVATMLFFAFVDPSPVVALLRPTAVIPDPTTLYSVGFLFFFSVCTLAAGLTAWLLTP
jgi:hypothetical protein